jgi:hypothetical protein
MALLNIFSKDASPSLLRLPSGSFTVDRNGTVVTRTLPSSFPGDLIQLVGEKVLSAFREAASADLPLSELVVNYTSLRITARELRGGAMIFLTPRTQDSATNQA